jgi:hypothetical protein
MYDLAAVYRKSLNFNPRIVVTKHCVDRLIDRKVDVEKFVHTLKDIGKDMEYAIKRYNATGKDVIFKYDGVVVPVVFRADENKLYVCTVFTEKVATCRKRIVEY